MNENIQVTLSLMGVLIIYLIFMFLVFFHTTLSLENINILDSIWILLIVIFAGRMMVPVFSPKRKRYMSMKDETVGTEDPGKQMIPIGKYEGNLYDSYRTHSITLASFTMTIIAIIVAFPNANQLIQNIMSLSYLSLAMVSFFISAYLFPLRQGRWFVYTGESLEYLGVVAVGIGLLSLLLNLTKGNDWLGLVYGLFVIAISVIAVIQIRASIRYFYGK